MVYIQYASTCFVLKWCSNVFMHCFAVQANVAGALCDECKPGSFHLTAGNPDGCLQCFCMGVTKQCASSTWTRDQVSLLKSTDLEPDP